MTFSWRRAAALFCVLVAVAAVTGAVIAQSSSSSKKLLVGLGDSYASGEGNEPFTPASDTANSRCHISISGAYPVIAAQQLKTKSLNNACSGATTDSLVNGSSDHPSQLTGIDDANYVTVTVGGDDVDALGAVFAPPSPAQYAKELADLRPKLVNTYKQIHAAARHARIVVVGYPSIVPQSHLPGCFLNANALTPLRTALTALNNTIAQAAQTAKVDYIDATNAFAGHEVCTEQPWVNGIDLGNLSASLHPNVEGQTALANLVTAKLR